MNSCFISFSHPLVCLPCVYDSPISELSDVGILLFRSAINVVNFSANIFLARSCRWQDIERKKELFLDSGLEQDWEKPHEVDVGWKKEFYGQKLKPLEYS
jgi:hypothetical protein